MIREIETALSPIVVVEDHPLHARLLVSALRQELAGDGEDAVLLDLHLPDMSGLPLVQAFRDRHGAIPLILHSAADETPEIDAVRHLVDAVVLKSRVDELLETLARLTDA
jgi:CheY-like chemotaxis protein